MIPTKELAKYKQEIKKVATYASKLEITDAAKYEDALAEGKIIKVKLASIVDRRKEITDPIRKALNSVMDLFRPIEETGEEAIGIIRGKMNAWHNEEMRIADAAKAKLALDVASGAISFKDALSGMDNVNAPLKTVVTENGKATARTMTKYRVTNKASVPLEFMEVDMQKVAESFKKGLPVPGCESYKETNISIC